jgi:hypothetical protein
MPGFLGGSSGSGTGGEIRFPAELIDPVTKLRVSEPQTLIDTDFEYGLQPTKWETVELINNTPSFFSKSGDTTIPNIESITTTATSREIKVTTGLAHGLAVGIPINVSGTKSLTADGAYIINSVPTPTTFTYLAKQNQPDAASIEDLYTSIVSGEFFQGSQIKIADSDGIITDAQGASTLTVTTESPHGFGLNTPFYFLNLNSTVSQEFDSSNTAAKAFDASNSSTAQVFDGSNTLTSYKLDLDNNAVATGTVSSISTFNPVTNQITVAHTSENFVGLPIGAPLYHNVTSFGGYFASNPRGVVFLKSLDTANTNGAIFTVSQVPNGSVIPVPNALTGTFQKANEARLFAGNNINTATEVTINLTEEAEQTFNGTNTGGQYLNNCSFSGSNVTGASGSGVADLDLYQGLMVKYETTGTPPTINAGGDASNGGSTTSLVNGRTYFIDSSFQVGSSINYVTTIREYPGTGSVINFTSAGSGTHTFTAIGIATDKDIVHLKNHGYVVGDMLRYTYPSGGHFGVNNAGTELKDFYFVERLWGSNNLVLNFTIGELTPKTQEFIGLTATQSSVNVTFTATGFTAPLTYSVTSGTLPSGLTLNTSTGAITGTPNAAYTQSTIRITVQDASASTDFADVTFQVNPAPFLYAFSSATFTQPNSRTGVSLSDARSRVNQPAWTGTYLNMPWYQGYQVWTVPQGATYRIRVAGAGHQNPGYGAVMQADFPLTQGSQVVIAVGSRGPSGTDNGCGGSFVGLYNAGNPSATTPLIVAGGGGSGYGSGFNTNTSATGGPTPRSTGSYGMRGNGNGGDFYHGGGGGGWFTSARQIPSDGSAPNREGRGFLQGLEGGYTQGDGGFGGGGGYHTGRNGGGGGGGYWGGLGGNADGSGQAAGFGGTSYINTSVGASNFFSTNAEWPGSSNAGEIRSGNEGYVTITRL